MPNVTNFLLGDQQVDIEDTVAREAAQTAQNTATSAQNTATSAQSTATSAQNKANEADELATRNNKILIGPKAKRTLNIVTIGDSYSEGYAPSGNNSGWSGYLGNYLNINQIVRAYHGGAGFTRQGSGGQTFTEMMEANVADNPEIIDYVICYGGYNDKESDKNTISSAVNGFVVSAQTLYPNAKILIGMCGWCALNGQYRINLLTNVIYGYQSGAVPRGAMIDGEAYRLLQNYNMLDTKDYIHPNATGNSLIAQRIAGILGRGSVPPIICQGYQLFSAMKPTAINGTIKGTESTFSYQKGSYATLLMMQGRIDYSLTTPITSYVANALSSQIDICYIPNTINAIFGTSANAVRFNAPVITKDASGWNFGNFNGGLYNDGTGIKISGSLYLADNSAGYKSLSNLSRIVIGPWTVCVPNYFC